jgi:hypothetical protein
VDAKKYEITAHRRILPFKHTTLTVAEHLQMLELARYGIPVSQIAKLTDRSNSAVYRLFRDLGVALKPSRRTAAQIETAISAVQTPAPQIATPAPRIARAARRIPAHVPPPKALGGIAGRLKRLVTPRTDESGDLDAVLTEIHRRLDSLEYALRNEKREGWTDKYAE